MRKVPWKIRTNSFSVISLLIQIAVIISLITLALITFTKVGHSVDSQLKHVSDVSTYLSTIYSAMALVIALAAYQQAIKRPKLRVKIVSYGSNANKPTLCVTPSNRVNLGKPHTQWQIFIENTGTASAKYPVVQIEFSGMFFNDDWFEGWDKVLHANAAGWYGIRWSGGGDIIVHPNFPLEIPLLYFSGMYVRDESPSFTVTVAADGFEPLRTTYRIELLRTEQDHDWNLWEQRRL